MSSFIVAATTNADTFLTHSEFSNSSPYAYNATFVMADTLQIVDVTDYAGNNDQLGKKFKDEV